LMTMKVRGTATLRSTESALLPFADIIGSANAVTEISRSFTAGESPCDETISGRKENGYRGCQTKSKSGLNCQKWTSQSPHGHIRTNDNYPGLGVGDHNFCRNPDGETGGIWCYTTDSNVRWEFCDPITAPSSGGVMISTLGFEVVGATGDWIEMDERWFSSTKRR
jgi:hypothetical protein